MTRLRLYNNAETMQSLQKLQTPFLLLCFSQIHCEHFLQFLTNNTEYAVQSLAAS